MYQLESINHGLDEQEVIMSCSWKNSIRGPVVIILVMLALPYWDKLQGIRTQALWPIFALYQQNWIYIPKPEPSLFLGFTWSLAIEEQFYLVWPALVYFLKKRNLIYTSIGIILFSIDLTTILISPFFPDGKACFKELVTSSLRMSPQGTAVFKSKNTFST